MAANVISLSQLTAVEHGPERLGMVADIEPVAYIHAIAIDGDGLSRQNTLNDHRNQFLRKLKRAIIIGAIRDDRRQAVSVMVGAHQHVARGFARRIRRIRGVRGGFGEISRRPQRAVNFVGRDVMKFFVRQLITPHAPAGFQQVKGAGDVGGDEIARPGDGTVHVRLRRQVHDVGDGVPLNHAQRGRLVAQINLLKNIFGRARNRLQIRQVPPAGRSGSPELTSFATR